MPKSASPPAFNRVDVVGAAYELAHLLKDDPSGLDRNLLQHGDELVTLFDDANFGSTFRELKKLKRDALEQAIQDISIGLANLRSSTIGVCFNGRNVIPFMSFHGATPVGSVVFSVGWKNIKAFQKWREGFDEEITQDEINAAIYRLTFQLSQLL